MFRPAGRRRAAGLFHGPHNVAFIASILLSFRSPAACTMCIDYCVFLALRVHAMSKVGEVPGTPIRQRALCKKRSRPDQCLGIKRGKHAATHIWRQRQPQAALQAGQAERKRAQPLSICRWQAAHHLACLLWGVG